MTQLLSYCPSFNADIFDRHFATITSQASGYTQEELAYLATSPVVKVYYETSWEPLEYNRNGVASGITPDIIRAIGADTGIDFEFVLFPSTGDIYSDIDSSSSDTRDTVMAVSYSYIWANSHDLLVTQPYIASSVTEVTRTADMEVHSVALAGSGYIASHVKDEYPELEVTEYPTFAECMDAVKQGDVDCTFVNDYQASYYRSADAYGNLSYQPDANIEQSISLGVTLESNPALFGVISKSLQRLSASTVQGIVNDNTVQSGQLTLNQLVTRYPLQATLIIGGVGILIGLLAVLLVTSRSRRLKNLQLEAANNAKSDFLSRMSHDIRTPMNGIIGMTEIAREQDNPPATTQCLDKIDRSSQFLLGLVNDILDMSKAESGKMELHPEPYPIDDFKSYLDSVIRPLCEGKGQTLRIKTAATDGVVPIIDILRYNQIMFNLLSNAVKYTPEGGTISLDVASTLLADHKERVVATVSDNGVGMSAEFREILFERSRKNRRDNPTIGAAFGLSIVKRIGTEGGTIVVESELGTGRLHGHAISTASRQPVTNRSGESEKSADYTR